MAKIAVFPGSFDPITVGHEALVRRGVDLFDEIVVALGVNSSKKYFFDLEKRKAMIEATFADLPQVRVETYEGLTIDFCKSIGAGFLLRGLRTGPDFEFERPIAQMNRAMSAEIETVFLVSAPEYSAINSTIVRDIIRHGGDVSRFIPRAISLDQ